MTAPRRWSTDAALSVALLALLVCLGGLLYVHHHYTVAQTVYEDHTNRLVITPHGSSIRQLNALAATADRWWWGQLCLSLLTLAALIAVVALVLRRRNERLAAEAEAAASKPR